MSTVSYREVLNAAHRLPPDAQAKLAATLLRDLNLMSRGKDEAPDGITLYPLRGMSQAELTVLAGSVLASGPQEELESMLEKNRQGSLSAREEIALDDLLAQADQVGLLRARARYTLSLAKEAGEPF